MTKTFLPRAYIEANHLLPSLRSRVAPACREATNYLDGPFHCFRVQVPDSSSEDEQLAVVRERIDDRELAALLRTLRSNESGENGKGDPPAERQGEPGEPRVGASASKQRQPNTQHCR
eukprot:3677267-Alexandrium_andersonii.AAC.1